MLNNQNEEENIYEMEENNQEQEQEQDIEQFNDENLDEK